MDSVNDRVMGAVRRYDITLDRAGLALGVGSLLCGLVVLVLIALGGQRDPLNLAAGWLVGTVLSGFGITAVGGPIWLAMHVAGWRRAHHAALVGAVAALTVFIGAQTYGFGLLAMPAMDSRTLFYRWLSAIGTSAILALVAAGIGAAMWRIAYRRHD